MTTWINYPNQSQRLIPGSCPCLILSKPIKKSQFNLCLHLSQWCDITVTSLDIMRTRNIDTWAVFKQLTVHQCRLKGIFRGRKVVNIAETCATPVPFLWCDNFCCITFLLMAQLMFFQVGKSRKTFVTRLTMIRFLAKMFSDMNCVGFSMNKRPWTKLCTKMFAGEIRLMKLNLFCLKYDQN